MESKEKKIDFRKNVIVLLTGSSLAQAIPIVVSPILTRIYSPEDFGIFAIYSSFLTLLAILSTGQYELAIMLPIQKNRSLYIFKLALLLNFLTSLMLLLLLFLFYLIDESFFEKFGIEHFIWLLPVSVFFVGCLSAINYYLNRQKNYEAMAINKTSQGFLSAFSNIVLGFFGVLKGGLIFGQLFSSSIVLLFSFKKIFKTIDFRRKDLLKIIPVAKKYINFPKYSLSSSFLTNISSSMPLFIIGSSFGSQAAGLFSLSDKVLSAPVGIIGSSFSQIVFQKIASSGNSEENRRFFIDILFKINIFCFPLACILFFYLKEIFSFVFGENWIVAGYYAQILLPMIYFRFVGGIFTSIPIIYGVQKKSLQITIINIILRFFALGIGVLMMDIILGIMLFSLFSSLVAIYRIFWFFEILKFMNKSYE